MASVFKEQNTTPTLKVTLCPTQLNSPRFSLKQAFTDLGFNHVFAFLSVFTPAGGIFKQYNVQF